MIALSDVEVFLEIVAGGSLTAAARALHLPKSSVARQLARLEEELGARLIARTTRSIALTRDGHVFLPHARRLRDDGLEAAQALRGIRGKASGLLTVSAPTTFGKMFIAPHLMQFRKRYPELRLRLQFTARKVPIGVGEADIAIRLGPIVDPNLGVKRLGQIDFCLVASPRYLKTRSMPKHPADLAAHDMIELRPPAGDHSLELHRQRKSQTIRYLPKISIDEPETAKLICVAAAGIAPLPNFLVAGELKSGVLSRVLDDWTLASAPINLVYASEAMLNARIQAFMNFVAETIGGNLPWQT